MKLAAGERARVMVVEDSASVRLLLQHIIEQDSRLEFVGAVDTAEEALRLIPSLRPNVISMDIHLPGMDGLTATREIMTRFPTPIVIVSDACINLDTNYSMEALRSGALAIVEKPGVQHNDQARIVARKLTTQLAIMSRVPVIRRRAVVDSFSGEIPATRKKIPCSIVVMAASTGGPAAFERVIKGLPADFPVPVIIVQHMGDAFLEGFANWLSSVVPMHVKIAQDMETLRAGHVYVAPGNGYLGVDAMGRARVREILDGVPPLHCPSADYLFDSAARAYGAVVLGVLLTGMGRDGALGLANIRNAGGYTIAEDESTAIVNGMPAAAVAIGAVCQKFPIHKIAEQINKLVIGVDPDLSGTASRRHGDAQ